MIYSIGHGSKNIDIFINELNSFNIKYLIDIRSNPYSKYNPQYNREILHNQLISSNIIYVYLGDNLGGLPKDHSCYCEGKVSYDLLKEKDFFKEGMKRLINASELNVNVAIMCSEIKPEECHRSKLIGQELMKLNISIQHIIDNRTIKDQITLINQLTKGKGVVDLFGEEPSFTSKKKYE